MLGEPKAQQRHRDREPVIGKNGRSFTPKYDPSSKDKTDFLIQVRSQAPPTPMMGPVRVDATFYFIRPRSHYGTGKNEGVLKESAPVYHTSKPDRDNCDKKCMDAMSKVFWHDDSQVCAGILLKLYSDQPRVVLSITEL